jgi:hypothetical protein
MMKEIAWREYVQFLNYPLCQLMRVFAEWVVRIYSYDQEREGVAGE